VTRGSTFVNFSGEEMIVNSMGGILGRHWYRGQVLFEHEA